MSTFLNAHVTSPIPTSYHTPPFPSLYYPFPIDGSQALFLYRPSDIWLFTLFWTLLFYAAMHAACGGCAVVVTLLGGSSSGARLGPGRDVGAAAEKGEGVHGGGIGEEVNETVEKTRPSESGHEIAERRRSKHGARTRARSKAEWATIWAIPVVFVITGGVEAFVAGSCVGGLLAAVYNSGNFRMSTWVPFVWGLINSLVLILSSFAIQGAL